MEILGLVHLLQLAELVNTNGNVRVQGSPLFRKKIGTFSSFARMYQKVGLFGKLFRRLSLAGSIGGVAANSIGATHGDISIPRWAYRTGTTGASLAVGFSVGGPPGMIIGGIIEGSSILGEYIYDNAWTPFVQELEWQLYNFKNQWRNGWRP